MSIAATGTRTRPPETEVNVGLVLAPLMLGALAYGVLGSVVVPALPLLQRDLHTSENGITWLLTAYFLAAAAATAVIGRLGDMFGKRRMLLLVLAVMAAGGLVCAVSNSLAPEIAGRAMQGLAGGLFPLAFGIIRDEFPHERVAAGIGAVTAMIGVGAVGIILPGLILPYLNWHWLFWIPMVITLIALAGTWMLVRESPVRPGGRVNWLNAALMVVGVTAVVLGISEGGQWGWVTGRTLGVIIGGVVVCGVWIAAETFGSRPLINMSLMRLRGVWTTNVVALLFGAGMYGAFAVYPIFAQLPPEAGFGYHAGILACGLYCLPMSIPTIIVSPYAGRLAARIRATTALTLGTLITAAGFGYMAVWSAHPYDMMISLGLMGLGFGIAFPTLMTVIVHSVPVVNVAETTGMNTVVRMLGGAIGTQVTAAMIAGHQRDGLPTQAGFTGSYLTLAAFMVVAALAAIAVGIRRRE
ncbi:MFS transporter [Nocardia sp. NPDC049149]|uniref:MFS transporter n=1 Tax=Nocardia sp. NPDC049149 TaxID=3364315 RepID=UPI00371E93D4